MEIDLNKLISTEYEFQDLIENILKKNKFSVQREKYLQCLDIREDESIKSINKRIDIYANKYNQGYYIELKDYRKKSLKQVFQMLGDLFIQIMTYKYIIETSTEDVLGYNREERQYFLVGFLLPINIGYGDIQQILNMFEENDIRILKTINNTLEM